MINVEIDGKLVETERGSTVMDAAHKAGVYIPHFCYHKKLSIAANCRMCLVEVEKAPKPLPACATPAADGMKVHTHSEMAVKAQKGVMEFLLINHPLDCPICDQGGECQLQDLAVGYGATASRYTEEKRIVMHKEIGALISTREMSRCIQCTRCVRFGQEIAGMMELGMAFRGEHSEIMSFVNSSVDSELSGNMIDLCPVGALTSKPFRYTARNWELSRRKSVSPHDSLGSNLAVHVKNNKVMRVTPVENEAINECWISDKDRFSYEGLNSAERLTKPMLKQDGKWIEVEWPVALEYVANGLRCVTKDNGAEQIAALATPHSTLEELYLLQKLMRGIGSGNVDFRLRQSDFSADGKQAGAPWLGMPVAEINNCDRFLIAGSFLRKDHPLLAQRVRQAVKRGAQANIVHSADDDLLMAVANKSVVAPSELVNTLAQILKALAAEKQVVADVSVQGVEVGGAAAAIAKSLASGERAAVLLGNFAQQHPQATQIALLAEQIAALCSAKFGFLGQAANSVGGYLAGAVPWSAGVSPALSASGMNAAQMLASPRKAYILLNVEPELDMHNPQQAMAAMHSADMVVAMSAYKHHATDYADVLLPIAPFTETSGTFVNTEGRVQSFKGAVKPLGEARPAWKVLRVLGNLLDVPGFDYDSSEAVRDEVLSGQSVAGKLNNHIEGVMLQEIPPTHILQRGVAQPGGFQRVSDVPIYSTDAVVRRAVSLQKTRDAATPCVMLHSSELQKLGMQPGDTVKVNQGKATVAMVVQASDAVPVGTARVAAGHPATAELGAMFGTITVEPGMMELLQTLQNLLGPAWLPIWTVVKILVIVVPIMLTVAYLTLAERKVIGFMQIRIGPNRVGPYGLLQPLADGVKLLLKEIIIPTGSSKFLFILAPIMALAPSLAAWAVVPFSDGMVLANLNAGLLYILAMTSLGVYGIIIAGWASNSKYAFLGAVRSAAQIVSYEIAMGFALVCVLLASQSMNLVDIVHGQQGRFGMLNWYLVPLFPMFLVYLIAGVAETNRAPFDMAEGESEIVAGFHVEYSGMAFALFFLAEYANMILVAFLTSIMFLGGWLSPLPFLPDSFIWLLGKVSFILFLFLWFRATFPRYRYDQLMRLGWKIFIPLTIIWVVVVAAWMQTPLWVW